MAVDVNVLKRLLLRKPNKPRISLIGSTVTYDMYPYAFFFSNQKVAYVIAWPTRPDY
jgi:hypothetical protein